MSSIVSAFDKNLSSQNKLEKRDMLSIVGQVDVPDQLKLLNSSFNLFVLKILVI